MERETMYNCINEFISTFDVLDNHSRFIAILASDAKDVLHSFGHFALNGFKKRVMSDRASNF